MDKHKQAVTFAQLARELSSIIDLLGYLQNRVADVNDAHAGEPAAALDRARAVLDHAWSDLDGRAQELGRAARVASSLEGPSCTS